MDNRAFLELRFYLDILRRRWVLIPIPVIIAALLSAVTFSIPQPTYSTSVQFIVSQEPTDSAEIGERARQFTWVTSQYVVNSLTDWVNGSEFAGRVSAEMFARGFDVDTEEVDTALEAGTIRSKLEIYIDHPNEETLVAIAESAALVAARDNLEMIPQLGDSPAYIRPIDEIIVEPIGGGLTPALMAVAMRLVVAAAAGVGLTLFLEYLDPKIRTVYQVQQLDLPILAEIPTDS